MLQNGPPCLQRTRNSAQSKAALVAKNRKDLSAQVFQRGDVACQPFVTRFVPRQAI